VAVDDGRLAPVVGRPLQAHGKPELVGLPRCLAEQREVADAPGRATLIGLLHPGVRDDELSVVEHDVADELVEEVAGLIAKLVRLAFELLQRLLESMRDPDVPALELSNELDVVIARQADGGAGLGHRHDELPRGVSGPRSP
jgi:hypothetical protein